MPNNNEQPPVVILTKPGAKRVRTQAPRPATEPAPAPHPADFAVEEEYDDDEA